VQADLLDGRQGAREGRHGVQGEGVVVEGGHGAALAAAAARLGAARPPAVTCATRAWEGAAAAPLHGPVPGRCVLLSRMPVPAHLARQGGGQR
jgi:hypothetical protein